MAKGSNKKPPVAPVAPAVETIVKETLRLNDKGYSQKEITEFIAQGVPVDSLPKKEK